MLSASLAPGVSKVICGLPQISPLRVKLNSTVICMPGWPGGSVGDCQHRVSLAHISSSVLMLPLASPAAAGAPWIQHATITAITLPRERGDTVGNSLEVGGDLHLHH